MSPVAIKHASVQFYVISDKPAFWYKIGRPECFEGCIGRVKMIRVTDAYSGQLRVRR